MLLNNFFPHSLEFLRRLSPKYEKPYVSSCLLLFCLSVSTPATTATESNSLSLQQAISKTMESNPELLAFGFQLKAQEGKVQQAGVKPSPQFSFELEDTLGTGDYSGVNNTQATFSIAWVHERGVRQHRIDAARAGSALRAADADIMRLDAAAETARLFLVSLAYQARMVNAEKTVKLAEDTIQAVLKRVQAGKSPEAELSRANAELARQKLNREDIEHEIQSAYRLLVSQWGSVTNEFNHVAGNILNVPVLESFDTLKTQLQQNPDIARILSNQRLKQAELDLELAQRKQNWQFSAGLRHYNETGDQAFVAGINIPYGEGTRNAGRIAEARANLEQTTAEDTALRVRIETTLYVLYEKLQHNLHVINTVRDEIIPPLEKAQEETRRAFTLGRYSYLEWRSVQSELLDAHNTLIEASISAHQNIIEIERLTGVRITQLTTQ